jgi:beta-N-acetylhexosaminidase
MLAVSNPCKSFIIGCKESRLTSDEKSFFSNERPWGLILFKRNIVEPQQVGDLVAAFRDQVGRQDAPVLVDQEGGRVQRLGPPHWRRYPSADTYLKLARGDVPQAARLAALGSRLIAHDLRTVGITVNCLPVLDCPIEGASDAIGDRAYADQPEAITEIGRSAAEGLIEGGVLPVIKHMPGQGRALVDSHYDLPLVSAEPGALVSRDFKPFQALRHLPMGMTGHVVFSAFDAQEPVTTSKRVISEVIRGQIGFDGLLLSDDLSMKALQGDFSERARKIFAAGCDIALHCNGNIDEARSVADSSPELTGDALRRAKLALSMISAPLSPFDPVEASQILDASLALLS